ncbi:putative ferric-chelate reductase 1 [Ixodes scapularis]|uniref:putative ferric-chelate reductase 1 n=1 Tax=Ixodes scapularis TaxID=6945 RepID=UPI001A9F0856|nr:putative ferric-chelate reductase 1 [Ixodes scapularis]
MKAFLLPFRNMMTLKVATSLVLVFLSAGICTGHPDGADDKACEDLLPSHGHIEMEGVEHRNERYHLVQDNEYYKPGDVITVTLSSEVSPFMGFLIKAFDENEKDVGSFRSTGRDSRAYSHCAGITHTWRNLKKRVVVEWLAPEDRSGKVHFKVTVVKQLNYFAHAIPSTLA